MSSWVNHTVLAGSSINSNGTSSHTCTFTAATAGNLLVAIVGSSDLLYAERLDTAAEFSAGRKHMGIYQNRQRQRIFVHHDP